MSIIDRLRGGTVAAMQESTQRLSELEEALDIQVNNNELLAESIAELESDNAGWLRVESLANMLEFTRQGTHGIAARARLNHLANPLIKRAVNVRTFYTWGQGVEISARHADVNTVVQSFLDDPLNQQVLFGHDGRQDKDRLLQLDGNLVFALVTHPVTGAVQVRTVPWTEITHVIKNPEDREDRWFYVRTWMASVVDPVTGALKTESQTAAYPALGYRPAKAARLKQVLGGEVRWDSPLIHIRVGGHEPMDFGISETYAALAWARAYKGFLEDWASLAKALSKYAWKATAKPGRVAAVKAKLDEPGITTVDGLPPARSAGAGQAMVSDGSTDVTPISKSGATLDANSGRPIAMMVAAAMDIPYTILMGDPDIGNLATAKTLDRPTELAMQSRREMWSGILRQMIGYAIDQAVASPQGLLKGQVVTVGTREVVTLAQVDGEDVDRNCDIEWPSILEHDVLAQVQALVAADDTGHVPPEIICRLLLTALGVENVDEVMDELTDDTTGEFLDPGLSAVVSAGAEAVRQFRAGQDPAGAVA